MEKKQVSEIRRRLGKTQLQMAQLLSVSLKAIQSFEQGGGISQSILNVRSFFSRLQKSPLPGKKGPAG